MKKKMLMGAIVCSILLTACGNSADTQTTGDSQRPGSQQETGNSQPPTDTEPESGPSTEVGGGGTEDTTPELDLSENEMLDLDTYSLVSEKEEYSQADYEYHRVSKGEMGYYYTYDWVLNVFDPELEMFIPVCNKPNCRHKDSTCVAFVNQ